MKVEAVFFDCDGVLADNEKEAHQVAFNQAFKNSNLDVFWDDDLYAKLINVGGGKERLKHFFDQYSWPKGITDKKQFINELHQKKSKNYQEIIREGSIQIRGGIQDFMYFLIKRRIPFAVCSTSKYESVSAIANQLLDAQIQNELKFIFAGDIVSRKKPDPEIYLKAAKTLNVKPQNCLVIEDSLIGLKAAKSAKMKVVITPSYYSKSENFQDADFVVNNLNDLNYEEIIEE